MNRTSSFENPKQNSALTGIQHLKTQDTESPKSAPSSASTSNSHLDSKIARVAMVAIPAALSLYAFNATSNSKGFISSLFHLSVGYVALISAYGLNKAQYEMSTNPNNGEVFNKGVEYTITELQNHTSIFKDLINQNLRK